MNYHKNAKTVLILNDQESANMARALRHALDSVRKELNAAKDGDELTIRRLLDYQTNLNSLLIAMD